MPDPIHQFEVAPLVPLRIFGLDVSFTNAALFMVLSVVLICAFLILPARDRSLVPNRRQSIAEISYEFIANIVRDAAGKEGMIFFPLIFTLFAFIFTANMLGMIPGAFTVTSQIVVTAALAVLVFATVLIVGFARHGFGFLRLFVPSGVPVWVLPAITIIEVISFLSRPISHSVRLFANMLAGHIALKVFGGFVTMLLGAGTAYAFLTPLPLFGAVALTALEVLVAFLQAYVFAMLTSMYLNDALHPGH